MHLWNDYEGTTIAGQWPLGTLLRTEGRSALFATTHPDGRPAVLRLTEALNDQAVLQARYRAIQAAGDEFLVKVEGFGDAELDGAPLSYAVLEPTQESLADILAQRRLAVEEAQEVGNAVAGGLIALHRQGLVHGYVDADSVLAAGDRIKLRSDCVRPAPMGDDALLEGAVTPQTDAFGLAGVLYRSLTQNRLHDASDALALPEPYATIVRNTARGTWGVPEIQTELQRASRAHVPPPAPIPAATAAPAPVPAGRAETTAAAAAEQLPVADRPLSSRASTTVAALPEESAWQQPERVSNASRRNILIAVAVVVAALLLFLLLHHSAPPARQASVTTAASAPASALETAVPASPAPAPAPAPATAAVAPAPVAAPGHPVWRVIAYTYNQRGEAIAKATALDRRFPQFHAAEWSRSDARPFLVTLGGELSRQDAINLRAKALHAGVSRDVYAQNYSH